MRETMNVPFSFAMIEAAGDKDSPRVARAAAVLDQAAKGLRMWKDPPGNTIAARAVFFEYAKNLETQVVRLQTEPEDAGHHLQAIRATCNGCHRFFRPSLNSAAMDVGYDLVGVKR
jgi:hypothetical protein